MDKESRNAFAVIGAVLVGLLAIGVVFSGAPDDAVIGEAPAGHGEAGEEVAGAEPAVEETAEEGEATASPEIGGAEQDVAAVSEVAPGPEESQAGEPMPETVTEAENVEGIEAEEAAGAEAAPDAETEADAEAAAAGGEAAPEEAAGAAEGEVALAGDPAGGERVFRQCQACHQVGEGAENRVGPHLTGVVGRQVASVEGFTYSDTLAALGQEGQHWTPDELRGFLADPREYAPGTAMAYAGVRSEDDLENLIAYLATFE